MNVYDTLDGSLVQSIQLNFKPAQFPDSGKIIDCNDKYLAFFDSSGNFQVFEYSHGFPVWAIILIILGGLLIIGSIIGFVIYKKKQAKRAG